MFVKLYFHVVFLPSAKYPVQVKGIHTFLPQQKPSIKTVKSIYFICTFPMKLLNSFSLSLNI